MKLHLGCSDDFKAGWLNVDITAPPAGSIATRNFDVETWRTQGGHVYQRADLNSPWPWGDSTVDEILANDVFEHIGSNHWGWYDQADGVDGIPYAPKWKRQHSRDTRAMFDVPGKIWCLNEAHRVLKPGGLLRFTVPCVMLSDGRVNPGAFCDPTHRTFWTIDDCFYFGEQWNTPDMERGRLGPAYGITALFRFPPMAEWKCTRKYDIEIGDEGQTVPRFMQFTAWRTDPFYKGHLVWKAQDANERAKIHACIEAVK